jgi:hypothetical protein
MTTRLEAYASWLVENKDKKGTEEFEKVSNAYWYIRTEPKRQQLEQELEQALQKRAEADYMLEAAEDTIFENLYEAAGEMSAAGVGVAVDTIDLFTSIPSLVGVDIPKLRDKLKGTPLDLDQVFVEEPEVRKALRLIGFVGTAGGSGAVQVARDPAKFSSALKDIAGLGMTKAPEAVMATALGVAAKETQLTNKISTDIKEMTDAYRPQIEVRALTPDGSGGAVKRVSGGYEYGGVRATGNAKEGYNIPGIGRVDSKKDIKPAIDDQFTAFVKAREQMQVEYNFRKNLQKVDEFTELRSMTDAPKRVTFTLGRQANKDVGLSTAAVDTGEDALFYKVSPELGGAVSVAAQSSANKMNIAYDQYLLPITPVIPLWRTNNEAAKAMLDYARGLKGNSRGEFFNRLAKAGVSSEEIKAVNGYLNFRGNLFKEQRLNIGEEVSVLTDRLHIQTQPTTKKSYATRGRKEYSDIKQDQSRRALMNRKAATDDMINEYQNPFLTDFQLLSQNDFLNEIAKRIDVGTLGVKSPTGREAFESITRRLAEDLPKDVAVRGSRIIEDMVIGSQRPAPAWAQIISNLFYGGTLMSLKSAVLNLHDTFVSPMLNGVSATIRGTKRSLDMRQKSFVDPELSGINRQTQGEFAGKLVNELNAMADDPSVISRLNRQTSKGLELGMKATLFTGMDRIGKRAVMNSVIENGYDLAKKGEFNKKWGTYFSEAERFTMINAFRKHGKNLEAMSEKELKLMSELAYAGLGQQQLTSVAGRPLAWSNTPALRPLYTLMGFAIVQRSLLRKKVFDAWKDKNQGEAAKNAALYIASAGVGYAVLDEARDYVFSGGEDKVTGGELLFKTLVDQPLSVLTLNKAPTSQYQFYKLTENPLEWAILSITPAGGLVEQGGKAGMDLIAAPFSKDPSKQLEKSWNHIMEIPALNNSIGTAVAVMGNPSFVVRKQEENKEAEAPSN